MELEWQKPDVIPAVNIGTEKQFWIAVELTKESTSSIITFLAQYQNRPYIEGDNDDGDALVSVDGDYISSIGWVTCQSHTEFDNFYTLLTFSEKYKLLAWAEYQPPIFTSPIARI